MGNFRMYDMGDENVRVITMGDLLHLGENPLLRIHSSCLASEVFGAQDCDCADQLRESMKRIATEGYGLIIHLHQEGRGQGLSKKICAVRLMESDSLDTVEAFEQLGLEQDVRTYETVVKLLKSLEICAVRLISNNPRKRRFLEKSDIQVTNINTHPNIRVENEAYLHTKNNKLGHLLPLEKKRQYGDEIRFYHSDQPWGFLSNFSPHSIYLEGTIWCTVEHYYQAKKFSNPELQNKIRLSLTPTLAKAIAKEYQSEKNSEWDSKKEQEMLTALCAKFLQHPELGDLLRSTGTRRLVEYTENDAYWAESVDGSGLNRLGALLMEVRSKLDYTEVE